MQRQSASAQCPGCQPCFPTKLADDRAHGSRQLGQKMPRGWQYHRRHTLKDHSPPACHGSSDDRFSLSIFTLEADRKPILCFEAKTHAEAEAVQADQELRAALRSMKSGGLPICDDYSIFRVRMARPDERTRYREAASETTDDLRLVYLIDLDDVQDVNR